MQSRAVHLVRHGAMRNAVCQPPIAPAIAQSQRWNSFIKNVMDQVKKDMENDPKLKEDWKKWQKTTETMDTRRARNQERLDDITEKLKSASEKTSGVLKSWKERTAEMKSDAARRASEVTEKNESLKKMEEFMKSKYEASAAVSSNAFQKTKGAFSGVT